jgi:hypothetical protein
MGVWMYVPNNYRPFGGAGPMHHAKVLHVMYMPYIIPVTRGHGRALEKMKFQDRPYSPKAEVTMQKYTASTIMQLKQCKTRSSKNFVKKTGIMQRFDNSLINWMGIQQILSKELLAFEIKPVPIFYEMPKLAFGNEKHENDGNIL